MLAITIATVLLISSFDPTFSEKRMSYHYQKHNLMVDQNLFIAAKNGDINLLRDLLNAGYPISNKDKYGKTALHHAVEGKFAEIRDFFEAFRFLKSIKLDFKAPS